MAFQSNAVQNDAFQTEVAPVIVATLEQVSNWQWPRHKRRLTEDELLALIRQQRIELGILPPDLPGQAIAAPAEIAREVAEAVHDDAVMAEMPIDYETIYRAAFLEAEIAIAQYKRARFRRKAAIAMLLQ